MLQYSTLFHWLKINTSSQEKLIEDLRSTNPNDRPTATESIIRLQEISEIAAEREEECKGEDLWRLFGEDRDDSENEYEDGSLEEEEETLEEAVRRLTSAEDCDLEELGEVMGRIFSWTLIWYCKVL